MKEPAEITEAPAEAAIYKGNLDQAAQILQSICHAISFADQECGKVQAMSNWLTLFEAAASHAHYLICGTNIDELNE